MSRDTFLRRVVGLRLAKGAIVGLIATCADLGLLTVLVEWFHVAPPIANLPALILGSSIQFVGNRQVVFNVKGKAKLGSEMFLFLLAEVAAFGLIAGGFYALNRWTPLNYVVSRAFVSFLVFIGFSFPIRSKIFHQKSSSPSIP